MINYDSADHPINFHNPKSIHDHGLKMIILCPLTRETFSHSVPFQTNIIGTFIERRRK